MQHPEGIRWQDSCCDWTEQPGLTAMKHWKAGRCEVESRESDPCTALWLHVLYALKIAVNPLAQFLARLEMRHMFRCQRNRIACFWVPADTRWAVMQGETPEAPDFDPLSGCQRLTHLFQQAFHGQLDIFIVKMTVLGRKNFDKFRLCHLLHHPD